MIILASTMADVASSFGIPALVAGSVAGLFGWLAQRTKNSAPTEVSTSYSTLVADLEARIDRMEKRADLIEVERGVEQTRMRLLESQVLWLLRHLPEELVEEFYRKYPDG